MGSELHARIASRALAGGLDGLSRPAYQCLAHMAVVARDQNTDDTEACLYFGGWAWLAAVALHRPPPYDEADRQAVQRAIRELIDGGHIKPHGRISGQQSNAVYELTL